MSGARMFAVVPLNDASLAKTRLAPALTGAERAALERWMAGRALAAILGSGVVAEVAVLSPSVSLLSWARAVGCVPIAQENGGLNEGLELAREQALRGGATALLALLGDLPFLRGEDVRAMVQVAAGSRPVVVVAPDRHNRGTNGLLMRPADAMPFAFGAGSLARHVKIARESGLPLRWYLSRGTRYDVDTPDDLRMLRATGAWSPGTAGLAASPHCE